MGTVGGPPLATDADPVVVESSVIGIVGGGHTSCGALVGMDQAIGIVAAVSPPSIDPDATILLPTQATLGKAGWAGMGMSGAGWGAGVGVSVKRSG